MSRHDKIKEAIFAKPTRADVGWTAVVSLVKRLGGTVTQHAGSRVAFKLNGIPAVLHQPHPGDTMKKYAVEDMRDFLTAAGYGPPGSAQDEAENTEEDA